MKKVIVALAFVAASFGSALADKPTKTKKSIENIADESKIEWLDIEEAAKRAKKKPKKILIDVYTDWCGWCKVMDKKTFSNAEVASYVNKNYYAVKMNAEKRDNIIFADKLYKFNEQGKSHELAIELMSGRMSYPTTVYLDEKLKVIQAVPGFYEAKDFDALIHYFAENQYKKEKWETYKANFQSKIQ